MSDIQSIIKDIKDWWGELVDDEHKGSRARLRRCDLREIFFNPDYLHLKQEIGNRGVANGLPVIASVLAFIDNDGQTEKVLAKTMAEGSDRPQVSNIRFRRLLNCATREELHPQLLRVVKILGQKSSVINIDDLIESLYYWGDKRKRGWAEEYYGSLNKANK